MPTLLVSKFPHNYEPEICSHQVSPGARFELKYLMTRIPSGTPLRIRFSGWSDSSSSERSPVTVIEHWLGIKNSPRYSTWVIFLTSPCCLERGANASTTASVSSFTLPPTSLSKKSTTVISRLLVFDQNLRLSTKKVVLPRKARHLVENSLMSKSTEQFDLLGTMASVGLIPVEPRMLRTRIRSSSSYRPSWGWSAVGHHRGQPVSSTDMGRTAVHMGIRISELSSSSTLTLLSMDSR